MTRGLFYAPPLPAALVDRGGGNLLHRTLGRRADPCRRLTRNLAAALCLFVFSAQAASASLMAGRTASIANGSFASIGNIRGNCRRNFAITALLRFSRRVLIVPIIAAATINSCIARKPRSAAVMSVAVIVTRAVCCVAIGSDRTPSCSPRTRRSGSRRTSPSCLIC